MQFDLELLKKLKPCTFKYDESKLPAKIADEKVHIGFIAQHVAELFSMEEFGIVSKDNVGLKINYIEFIPLLVKWSQLLLEKIELQDKEIKELKSKLNNLLEE